MRGTRLLPAAESLESRRFMDATLTGGELLITGTESRDAITVTLDKGDPTSLLVTVGRERSSFALDQVDHVTVNALGGNDKVIVSERAGSIFKGVTVDAGAGNDTVVTGSGSDVILGGAGNDSLSTGDGDDYLYGGDGKDKLDGGDANDYLDAGAGNDALTGGDGDDALLAGDGKDKLKAGDGNDNVDGGAGKDSIKTGVGDDAIAADDSASKEVKDRAATDTDYRLAQLTDSIAALHESVVPGSNVFRCELADNGYMSLYYRFGDDPVTYKTVLDVNGALADGVIDEANLDGHVNLVSREVSVSELRAPAVAVFNARTPNLGIVSFRSIGNGYGGPSGDGEELRYRDADGVIQTTTTNDIAWSLDEAEEDLDDDGLFDNHGNGGGGNGQPQQGVAFDPTWTSFTTGGGQILYQNTGGGTFQQGSDGLFYPYVDNGQSGGNGGGH